MRALARTARPTDWFSSKRLSTEVESVGFLFQVNQLFVQIPCLAREGCVVGEVLLPTKLYMLGHGLVSRVLQ